MGHNRRYRNLYDADRYDADFVVFCSRCGYRVMFERRTLIAIFSARGVNLDVTVAGAKLRCTACRHRGGTIELTAGGTTEALRLSDGDSLPPQELKVSITQWCRMTENERKRIRRLVRG